MEVPLSHWRANVLLAVVSLFLFASDIQASGVVEYALPTPGNNALELVLGPDGNFWFADTAGNEIGYITSQGVVKEFSLPIAKSAPADLIVGPDGNLWFTEVAPPRIGRISTAGVIREFMLPDPNRIARLLRSGPDGNLWFLVDSPVISQPGKKEIARISTSGSLTFFPLPELSVGYFAGLTPDRVNKLLYLTTFPDYRLGSSALYQVTLDGNVTPHPQQISGILGSIHIDDSGTLWLTGYYRHDGQIDNTWLAKYPGNASPAIPPYGYRAAFFQTADNKIWAISSETGGRHSVTRVEDRKNFVIDSPAFPQLIEGGNEFWYLVTESYGFFTEFQKPLPLQRIGRVRSDGSRLEYDLAGRLKFSRLLKGMDNQPWVLDQERNVLGKLILDGPNEVVTVSAASYLGGAIAPDSIASLFGNNLTAATEYATKLPLPDTLAGIKIRLTDKTGQEQLARLFFASPNQINFLVPTGLQFGNARISVMGVEGREIAAGSTILDALSPGIFSVDANGQGLAAAFALRVLPDGTQRYEPIWQRNAEGKAVPLPIDLKAGGQVFLILFGSGLRMRGSVIPLAWLTGVSFGTPIIPVTYAGAQGDYPGLDQVNLLLPDAFTSGPANVALWLTDGSFLRKTNAVEFAIK